MSQNQASFREIEELKQGITSFILRWMMLQSLTSPEPGKEPLAWVRDLCDSIEDNMSKTSDEVDREIGNDNG